MTESCRCLLVQTHRCLWAYSPLAQSAGPAGRSPGWLHCGGTFSLRLSVCMSESWRMVRNTHCGDVWKSRQFSVILQYKEPPWHGSIWIKGCALTHLLASPGKKCWIPLLCRFFRSWAHSPGTSEMEIRLFLMSVWMTWGSASHWGRTLSTCEKNAVWG